MNGQNNNSNEKVKSKFFNQELFNDANVNDVGSSTSGQVISWGVGGNRKSNPEIKDVSAFDSTQMFNFVNTEVTDFQVNDSPSNESVVISDTEVLDFEEEVIDEVQSLQPINVQPVVNNPVQQVDYANNIDEVLADARVDSSALSEGVANEFVQSNPTFTGYNADPNVVGQNNGMLNQNLPLNNNVDSTAVFAQGVSPAIPVASANLMMQSSPLFAMATESQMVSDNSNNNSSPLNFTANDGVINDQMVSNQPLSLMALSGETIDESQKTNDVVENSKYFQSTPLESNQPKEEEVVPVSAPVVDVLAEPVRDVNYGELVRTYVGAEYREISMSPFSFWGAIFGNLYFFYRKMFLEGIILTVLNFVIIFIMFKNYVFGLGLSLGEFIIIGLLTNPIYLFSVDRKVKHIAKSNPKSNQYELQKICQLKGGTNLALGFILVILCNLFGYLILFKFFDFPSYNDLINGSKNVLKSDNTVKLEDLINYQIPADFKKDDTGEVLFLIQENVKKKGESLQIKSCGFDINLVDGYDTAKKLVTHMADTDKRYNRVGTYKTSNGEIWDTYEYDGGEYFYYYRAREFDGHIVLVTYAKHKYSTEGMCDLHLESIMNSIKIKNRD